jgi:hypothetical protein
MRLNVFYLRAYLLLHTYTSISRPFSSAFCLHILLQSSPPNTLSPPCSSFPSLRSALQIPSLSSLLLSVNPFSNLHLPAFCFHQKEIVSHGSAGFFEIPMENMTASNNPSNDGGNVCQRLIRAGVSILASYSQILVCAVYTLASYAKFNHIYFLNMLPFTYPLSLSPSMRSRESPPLIFSLPPSAPHISAYISYK